MTLAVGEALNPQQTKRSIIHLGPTDFSFN